jgi:hypothetical protein
MLEARRKNDLLTMLFVHTKQGDIQDVKTEVKNIEFDSSKPRSS